MAISFLTRKPQALTAMVRMFRERLATRWIDGQLGAVSATTLRDIGMTRLEVFAGVRGDLNVARP